MPPAPFVLTSVPRLPTPSGKSPEPLEEPGERFDDPLLLVAMVGLAVEPRHWLQDAGDLGARCAQLAVPERGIHERPRLLQLELVRFDELLKLGLSLRGDVRLPLLIDRALQRHRLDEVLDEVALAAEGRARVDRAGDLGTDFFVVAVALLGAELLDEHEDVVDVDLDLLDELDLEGHVIVDAFLVPVPGLPELGIQVEIHAAVVLAVAFREDLVSRVLVEGTEDVLQPQDRTE